MSGLLKQEHAESRTRPYLMAFNAMKLAISIAVLMMFVQALGAPHPMSDPTANEKSLPAVSATAHAEGLPKPKAPAVTPAPAASTPTFNPNDPATYPTCTADQVVWAQDGQCHQKVVASPVASAPITAVAGTDYFVANCGDNSYAHDIYMNESGCHTHNPNGSGCDGIGQACPASKVIDQCGYDYACQNAWFSNYAVSRYGSWAQADSAWHSQYDSSGHHWW